MFRLLLQHRCVVSVLLVYARTYMQWDVVMDWGFVFFTRDWTVHLRHRTLLPVAVYPLVAVLNFILRFSWAMNRFAFASQLHASVIVLLIELGEVFRRSVWCIFRIEWEVLVRIQKQQQQEAEGEIELAEKEGLLRGKLKRSVTPPKGLLKSSLQH